MIAEALTPANPLDLAIRDAIRKGDATALASLNAALSAPVMEALLDVAEQRAASGAMITLADGFASQGLRAAAAAALDEAAERYWVAEPQAAAMALDALAQLEHGLGLSWSAAADRRCAARLRGEACAGEEPPVAEGDWHFIVDCWNDPGGYKSILDGLATSPLRDDPLRDPYVTKPLFLGLDARERPPVQDFSFFVCDDDGPVLQVECDAFGRRYLGCRETAIALTRLRADHAYWAEAEALALRQCEMTSSWSGCPKFLVEVGGQSPPSAVVMDYLRRRANQARSLCGLWIDLNQGEARIEADYRTNHKRCIRWGRDHLRVTRHLVADGVVLDAYFDLHQSTGRLAPLRRDGLAQQMDAGSTQAYLARLDGRPVGVLLITLHGTTAYYSAGASNPAEAKPSAHFLMHRAILDAKNDGLRRFDFGHAHVGPEWSDKLRNIGHFKLGFTRSTAQKAWFSVPTRPQG